MTIDELDSTGLATVTSLEEGPPTTRASSYRVTVVHGVDAGKTLLLDGAHAAPVLVGQSPVCEFRLGDPQVSRRHATLDIAKDKLRIADLRSTNGTKVNGIRILEALLAGGEVITLGETALQVDLVEEKTLLPLPPEERFGRMIGASPAMRRLYPLCRKLAASKVPVLIEGETGTGKELLAEALHEQGPRAKGPFIVFDVASAPTNLVESMLFGQERTAGGAEGEESRRGLFEDADGGTLFIDEVGELDLGIQAKLLRVLEREEIRPVGGDSARRVDVRVLAATRRDLDREVQLGRFRDDLFFRIAVGRIQLPPLRDRHGDVALLAHQFLQELGSGTEPESELLRRLGGDRSWPGNVRELQNYVAQFLAIGRLPEYEEPQPATNEAGGFVIEPGLLDLPLTQARHQVLGMFERAYVARVLARHGGNVTRAAAASGIARRYFQLLRARSRKDS